jgi:Zn-finger nucleic acid-binding protein
MHPCPKCRKDTLTPISFKRAVPDDPRILGPSRCTQCHGVWLPHEAVVLELKPSDAVEPEMSTQPTGLDAQVGFCPLGHGLMTRAMGEGTLTFHLDRCEICRGVWFDSGEWAVVAAGEWLRHLDDLWDPVHRKRMREQSEHAHRLAALHAALGDATYSKVVELAELLRDHPEKSVALAYLLDEARHHKGAAA